MDKRLFLPTIVLLVLVTASMVLAQTPNRGEHVTFPPQPPERENTPTSLADMMVSKSVSVADVTPGGLAWFSIIYQNKGQNLATGVVITDTLPEGTSLETADGSPIVTGNRVVWNLGTVNCGPEFIIRYLALAVTDTMAVGTVLTNVVQVSTASPESDYTNNSFARAFTVVTPTRDLGVSKYLYNGIPAAGQVITYQVHVTNWGNAPARNIIVTDTLPIGTSFVTGTTYHPGWTFAQAGNVVTWTRAGLSSGLEGPLFYLTARIAPTVPAGTLLSNVVCATTTDPEVDYTNNCSSNSQITVSEQADMVVRKFPYYPVATAGGLVSYDIYRQNKGVTPATDVVITDTIPDGTSLISASGSPVVTGNHVVWNLGTVGYTPYELGNHSLTLRVRDTVAVGTVLTNLIRISTTSPEEDYSNNVFTTTTIVLAPTPMPTPVAVLYLPVVTKQ